MEAASLMYWQEQHGRVAEQLRLLRDEGNHECQRLDKRNTTLEQSLVEVREECDQLRAGNPNPAVSTLRSKLIAAEETLRLYEELVPLADLPTPVNEEQLVREIATLKEQLIEVRGQLFKNAMTSIRHRSIVDHSSASPSLAPVDIPSEHRHSSSEPLPSPTSSCSTSVSSSQRHADRRASDDRVKLHGTQYDKWPIAALDLELRYSMREWSLCATNYKKLLHSQPKDEGIVDRLREENAALRQEIVRLAEGLSKTEEEHSRSDTVYRTELGQYRLANSVLHDAQKAAAYRERRQKEQLDALLHVIGEQRTAFRRETLLCKVEVRRTMCEFADDLRRTTTEVEGRRASVSSCEVCIGKEAELESFRKYVTSANHIVASLRTNVEQLQVDYAAKSKGAGETTKVSHGYAATTTTTNVHSVCVKCEERERQLLTRDASLATARLENSALRVQLSEGEVALATKDVELCDLQAINAEHMEGEPSQLAKLDTSSMHSGDSTLASSLNVKMGPSPRRLMRQTLARATGVLQLSKYDNAAYDMKQHGEHFMDEVKRLAVGLRTKSANPHAHPVKHP